MTTLNDRGNIEPTWCLDDFYHLKFNQDTVDDQYLNEFLDAGHNRDQMAIYNYFEPNPMPSSLQYIKSKFSYLKNLTAAINLVLPGQYLPCHSDLYARWKHVHNFYDSEKIKRIIVMLEDCEPGQILEINNIAYTSWKAGDWFSWTGTTKHAIYNMSLKKRYAVQITGNL